VLSKYALFKGLGLFILAWNVVYLCKLSNKHSATISTELTNYSGLELSLFVSL